MPPKPIKLSEIPPPVAGGLDVNVGLFPNRSVTFVVTEDAQDIARIVVWADPDTHEVQAAIVGAKLREIV